MLGYSNGKLVNWMSANEYKAWLREKGLEPMTTLFTIYSGLRGPDFDEETGVDFLKQITSAVVRHLAEKEGIIPLEGDKFWVVMSPEGARELWDEALTYNQPIHDAARQLWQKYRHFRSHTICALNALGDGGKNHADWLKTVLRLLDDQAL